MKEKKEMSVDELTKEVSHLRSQIGGFRKANDMYRKKIKKLEKLAKHNRAVDIEGDHLYEEKLAELEQTKKELGKCIRKVEDKESDIEALQKKCSELLKTNKDLENRVAAFEELIDEAERTIAELRKPWWKRLF